MPADPKPVPTVRDSWESFALSVIPKDAPRTQYTEMRRAFYAGAYSALCRFAAIGGDDVSEAEGVAVLEQLDRECRAFQADVLAGRA